MAQQGGKGPHAVPFKVGRQQRPRFARHRSFGCQPDIGHGKHRTGGADKKPRCLAGRQPAVAGRIALRRDQQIRSASIGLEHLNRVASGASQLDGEVMSLPCARRKAITDAQQRSALRLRKSLRQ